jgi:hypothetical protein
MLDFSYLDGCGSCSGGAIEDSTLSDGQLSLFSEARSLLPESLRVHRDTLVSLTRKPEFSTLKQKLGVASHYSRQCGAYSVNCVVSALKSLPLHFFTPTLKNLI